MLISIRYALAVWFPILVIIHTNRKIFKEFLVGNMTICVYILCRYLQNYVPTDVEIAKNDK